ncbi:MAG TPA: hypothetical protein VJ911_06045 [Cryomorphaceae bacterium]|nr:hypothetical protein [Cryomorphaceae bacterium]
MKKRLRFNLIALLLACVVMPFYGCEEDENEPPSNPTPTEENPTLATNGVISAEVDGQAVDYQSVLIPIYGLSGTFAIIGIDTLTENITNRLRVVLPLEPTTGSFDHTDPGFNVDYEVIVGNAESGYLFNRDKESEINVMTYDSIGFSADTTFYKVEGTFSTSGKRQMSSDSVNIENGEFELVYGIWF